MEDNNDKINIDNKEFLEYQRQQELQRQQEEYARQQELQRQQEEYARQQELQRQQEEYNRLQQSEKPKPEKKPKKEKAPKNYFSIILHFIYGLTIFGLTGAMLLFNGSMAWIISAFAFLLMSMMLIIFVIFLSKKTHALMEFNALITGKPISLFFTDHKKLEWRVTEPEGNILTDKKYGSFLINEKGAYVDSKTKNIYLAFNPAVATNAAVECYKVTDSLNKVLNDEKQLSYLRYALSTGEVKDNKIIYTDPVTKQQSMLNEFEIIRENVNFSHLKSLLVTLIPHSITSKIEMTVQQRMSGIGKVNVLQIVLIIVGIIGAITLAIMLLNMYGGGGETIIKEVATNAAPVAEKVING